LRRVGPNGLTDRSRGLLNVGLEIPGWNRDEIVSPLGGKFLYFSHPCSCDVQLDLDLTRRIDSHRDASIIEHGLDGIQVITRKRGLSDGHKQADPNQKSKNGEQKESE
jgi:hypothetical protein